VLERIRYCARTPPMTTSSDGTNTSSAFVNMSLDGAGPEDWGRLCLDARARPQFESGPAAPRIVSLRVGTSRPTALSRLIGGAPTMT
jgi:hypothetical protein